MEKEKPALQEDVLQQGATSAQEQDLMPEKESLNLIVLAYPGTESLVRQIWEKFYDLPLRVIPFAEGDKLVPLLENVMAMEDVASVFTVVPANLVPCAPVRWSELQTPRVDDIGSGKQSFWGRVPVCFNKDVLVDFLPDNADVSDEEFVKRYIGDLRRPDLVSHSYGNFYTKVLRATPCEAVVIEGLVRKRFIYASVSGWEAITDLLMKALL